MEVKLNYESVPIAFAHCFNKKCVQRHTCMRYQAGKICTPIHTRINIINPVCIPQDTANCPYFHVISTRRVAWGIRSLYDNLPLILVPDIKRLILAHLGKSAYYRIYRKERGLLPEEQHYIRTVFKHKGAKEEPKFESYTEEFIWDLKPPPLPPSTP